MGDRVGDRAGSAQIAFMNPGGLRADMVGIGTAATRRRSPTSRPPTVQPFANTLVNMDLTGAQIKAALEQQWQPTGAARPFLRLGISEGFTYTYDPDAAARARRITGMWLNGTGSTRADDLLGDGQLVPGRRRRQLRRLRRRAGQARHRQGRPAGAWSTTWRSSAPPTPLPVDYSQRAVGPTSRPTRRRRTHPVARSASPVLAVDDRTGRRRRQRGGGEPRRHRLGTFPVTTTPQQTATPGFDEVGTATVTVTLPPTSPPVPTSWW